MRDMTVKEREVIESTMIAFEQYVASFIFAVRNPGANGPLNAARSNLVSKVEEFMKNADQ